jgi:hypothetical protein
MGIIDISGGNITDNDLLAHALSNASESLTTDNFLIRRSSAFINEYARLDEAGLHTDSGPSNPNHLLGSFPTLFLYGKGGFKVA